MTSRFIIIVFLSLLTKHSNEYYVIYFNSFIFHKRFFLQLLFRVLSLSTSYFTIFPHKSTKFLFLPSFESKHFFIHLIHPKTNSSFKLLGEEMWDSFLYVFSNENPKLRLSVEHSKGKTLKRKEKAKVGTSDDIWKNTILADLKP